MSPAELAKLHPCLYHVTNPEAWDLVSRLGLLSSSALLKAFEVDEQKSRDLTTRRRPKAVEIRHPVHGVAQLNDNQPLSERKLAKCLDDGLRAEKWLHILNERIFFWSDRHGLSKFLSARSNRNRARLTLKFDTKAMVEANFERVEISPINSGATNHVPARRGNSTFTPIVGTSYEDWQRQRGRRDVVKEVIVKYGIPDIHRFLVGTELTN